MKIKTKVLERPWITTGIKISSKKKQSLYSKILKKEKYLKKRKRILILKKAF